MLNGVHIWVFFKTESLNERAPHFKVMVLKKHWLLKFHLNGFLHLLLWYSNFKTREGKTACLRTGRQKRFLTNISGGRTASKNRYFSHFRTESDRPPVALSGTFPQGIRVPVCPNRYSQPFWHFHQTVRIRPLRIHWKSGSPQNSTPRHK